MAEVYSIVRDRLSNANQVSEFEVADRVGITNWAYRKLLEVGLEPRSEEMAGRLIVKALGRLQRVRLLASSPRLPRKLRGIYEGRTSIDGVTVFLIFKNYHCPKSGQTLTIILSVR
jgi:hypothetical protein